jgi:hydroxymethylpyrimidine kinase/phosphomethylpyrimidine kinase
VLVGKMGRAKLVVDPVVRSTSGFDLVDDDALRSLIKVLFPLAELVTPNRPEAERITGLRIETMEDIGAVAKMMQSMGARNVLIKGGHPGKEMDRRTAVDHLFIGEYIQLLEDEFVETSATHGTGCTLAAAITANLALGKMLPDAVAISKRFVTEAIRTAPMLGHGHSPINIS